MSKKDLIPLPHAPHETIKVKAGTQIVWQQDPRNLYDRKLLPAEEYDYAVDMPDEAAFGLAGLMLAIPALGVDAVLGAIRIIPSAGLGIVVMATVVGLPIGGIISGIIPGFHQRRTARKLRLAIKTSLSTWVNERYNLHTTAGTFTNENLTYLMSPTEWKGRKFETDGKHFHLRRDENSHIYIEEQAPEVIYDYRPEASIAAIEANEPPVVTNTLTGEAAVLSEKIFDLLKLLADFDLSTAHTHTVKRVREDLQTTLDLHKNLTRLGEIPAESKHLITSTLTALGAELDEVIAAERDAINKQLLVQQRYVQDRKQHPAVTDLALDRPTSMPSKPEAQQLI